MDKIPVIGIRRIRIGNDGSGVRTLIGIQGCPLSCHYCINKQALASIARVRLYTPEELYRTVSVDSLYYKMTNGGITLGGGEPLAQMQNIEGFVRLCSKEWSVWAETSLHVDREIVKEAAKLIGHFIVDIKTTDPVIYHRYTGGEFQLVYDNLKYLLSEVGPERIIVRIPMIPNYTDKNMQYESEVLIRKLGIGKIDKFTYKQCAKETIGYF